jgi:enoyl-[acyl-carrier protein] reductase I
MASLFMMSYYGAERAIELDNVLGPVNDRVGNRRTVSGVRVRSKRVRVHAISLGPVKTRAASGIDHFDELMDRAASRAPMKRLVSIEDVGLATAILAADHAKLITGETVYVDGGYHILG